MNKDRLIQAVALGGSLLTLAGAAFMSPSIQEQRVKDQLVAEVEINEATPPGVALAVTALGSFRGIAANVMWYRLEMLKREGEFYEADTLSRMITTLQPRFPQVWVFMAWNMAYNISVETHTPKERWDWVNKGIRLLREEAIPMNPNAIRLYRELGWFHFHKVGERTDDMHKYYKYKFADEWDQILGPMYEGRTDRQIVGPVIDPQTGREIPVGLRSVVAMTERYWKTNRPDYKTRTLIRGVIDLVPKDVELKKLAYDLEEAPLDRLLDKTQALEDRLRQNTVAIRTNPQTQNVDIDAYLRTLRENIQRQVAAARVRASGESGFFADFAGQSLLETAEEDRAFFRLFAVDDTLADIRPLVEKLNDRGLELNRTGLLQMGRVIGVVSRLIPQRIQQYRYWKMPAEEKQALLKRLGIPAQDLPVFDLLMEIQFHNMTLDTADNTLKTNPKADLFNPFVHVLMPYWRAKVLNEQYRMDPVTMQLLMDQYGPIDWRHPAAHGVYWGQSGLQRTMQLLDANRIDVVNTQRGVIHGIQSLERYGRVILNPYADNPNDRVTYQPHFAFADAYEKAMFASKEIYATLQDRRQGGLNSFDHGHENFLVDVTNRAYIYGDLARAERFYLRARTLYGTDEDGTVDPKYAKPLPEFVYDELSGDILRRYDVARNILSLMVQRAFKEGIATGNTEHYEALMRQAKTWFDQYQASKASETKATSGTSRLMMEPWPEFVANAFTALMLNPAEPPQLRNIIVFNTEPGLVKAVAERLYEPLGREFGGDWRWLAYGSPDLVPENAGPGPSPGSTPGNTPGNANRAVTSDELDVQQRLRN